MKHVPFLLVMILAAAGCGRDLDPPPPPATALTPARFAAVFSDLIVARVETLPDTAAYGEHRDAVLDRHGVSAADVDEFVAAYGQHDALMEEIYLRVGARLDSLFGRRVPGFPRTAPDKLSGATFEPGDKVEPAAQVEPAD